MKIFKLEKTLKLKFSSKIFKKSIVLIDCYPQDTLTMNFYKESNY